MFLYQQLKGFAIIICGKVCNRAKPTVKVLNGGIKMYRSTERLIIILLKELNTFITRDKLRYSFSIFIQVKVLKSQVVDRRPTNNPIQGRCY